jgi:hypothetical protein
VIAKSKHSELVSNLQRMFGTKVFDATDVIAAASRDPQLLTVLKQHVPDYWRWSG